MSEQEILPIVDEEGNLKGKATRAECHSNPNIIHPVVWLWIFNTNGEILLQQRSKNKIQAPLQWDVSCGGHVKFDQTINDALITELNEELGISLDSDEFQFIEKRIFNYVNQTELAYQYYVVVDFKLEEFDYSKEEIEDIKYFDLNNWDEYLAENYEFSQIVREQLQNIYSIYRLNGSK